MNDFQLKGKKAIVTGGEGLLGSVIAAVFSEAGAKVHCLDVFHRGSDEPRIKHLKADVGRPELLKNLIEDLFSEGEVHVWVNCAYPRTSDWGKPEGDFSARSWRENVESHLVSYCYGSQCVAEEMRKRKAPGSIINIGSIYGTVGNDFSLYEGLDMHHPAAYSAIKGGVVNFSRYLASRYGEYGIRVNALCPGGIASGQDRRFIERYSAKVPLRRLAQPKEIANAALFLASDAASYITGAVLMADGGWTAI